MRKIIFILAFALMGSFSFANSSSSNRIELKSINPLSEKIEGPQDFNKESLSLELTKIKREQINSDNLEIYDILSIERFKDENLGWCWNITYSCGAQETFCEWQLQGGNWSTLDIIMLIWDSDYYICG